MSRAITNSTTSASVGTFVVLDDNRSVTLIGVGLVAAETADIQILAGSTYVDVYEEGTQKQMTATNTAVRIRGVGEYRVNKGTSIGASAIYLAGKNEHSAIVS